MFERLTAEARQVVALVPQHAAGRAEMTAADLAAALMARPVGNTAGIWTPPKTDVDPAEATSNRDSDPAEATSDRDGDTVAATSQRDGDNAGATLQKGGDAAAAMSQPLRPPGPGRPAGPADVRGEERRSESLPRRFDDVARSVLEQALQVAMAESAGHIGTEHLLASLVRSGPAEVVAALGARGATGEAVDALLARLAGGPGVEGPPEEPRAAEGAGSALSYTRLTVDARAVVREGAALSRAAGRDNVTPVDLATALALYDGGNVQRVWTAPPVPAGEAAAPIVDVAGLAGPVEKVLTAAAAIARAAGAAQVGTEHLLVALIRHGHPEVVTLLAERGGTAEAADALLAGLGGDPGVEVPPEAAPGPLVVAPRPAPRPVTGRQAVLAFAVGLVLVAVVVVCVLGPIYGP